MTNLNGIGNPGADGYGSSTATTSIGGVGGAGGPGLKIVTPLNTGNQSDRITGTGGVGGTGYRGPEVHTQFILPELNAVMYSWSIAPGQGGNGGTGIDNRSNIDTGNSNDVITGLGGNGGLGEYGYSGAYCPEYSFGGGGFISAIPGIGGVGIDNRGHINTGNGNDLITGMGGMGGDDPDSIYDTRGQGGVGIDNRGYIHTGNGNDLITGMSGLGHPWMPEPVSGLLNSGSIDTGNGNDSVRALTHNGATGRLGGGGRINLGNGDDLIEGYGSQFVDGGRGFDTAKLGIAYEENLLSLGSSSTSITIGEMTFTGIERFIFSDAVYSLAALQALI